MAYYSAPIRRSDIILVNVIRTRGRPRQTWMNAIKKDMKVVNLTMGWPLTYMNGKRLC